MIELSAKEKKESRKSSSNTSTPRSKARPHERSSQEEESKETPHETTGSSLQEEVPMETEEVDADEEEAESEVEVEPEYVSKTKSSRYVADNPWILYEAGVVIAKDATGKIELNDYEEKIVHLNDFQQLFWHQQVALTRQDVNIEEWEQLPWTGYMCHFFTMAWHVGREYYLRMRKEDYQSERHNVDKDLWPQLWLDYERCELIQGDFNWTMEAIYELFSTHLDKFIRENPCLWGDCCEMDPSQPNKLSLDREGYNPYETVPAISKTIKPRPELHFKFSTRMMMTATVLYKEGTDFQYKNEFAKAALKSLETLVERRRRSTQESLELMVEEVYTRYMNHEAFLSSARARTNVKYLKGTVIQEKSKKLEGYAWYLHKGQSVRVPPARQGETIFVDDEDDLEEKAEIPQLEVKFTEKTDAKEDAPADDLEDPFNPYGVDGEGSEQSEVSPTGRYSGQTSEEEAIEEAEESRHEYDPGASTVTKEALLVGQFARLAKARAEEGEDIILVDQLSERHRVMIKRMVQNLYNNHEDFVNDPTDVVPDEPIPSFTNYEDVPQKHVTC